MNKIIRLVKVQLGTVFVDMLSIGGKRKTKKNAVYGGIALFSILLGIVSFFYSYMIGNGLMMFDSIEILPALMMSVTSLIVLIPTVLKVKGTIFGSKDYDMVMSLPVRTSGIVASRLLLLYCVNMLFVFIVMIPMMIAYGILAQPEVLFYVTAVVTMLALPLIPIAIASILGTVIAYVASKFRYSNFVSIIVSIGLFVALIGASFVMGDTEEEMINMSRMLTDQVKSVYPLAGMYTKAVCEYDLLSFFTFLAISIFAFLLYSFIVGKLFKKINTLIMTGKYRTDYKMQELKQSSPLKALYKKEIKRYFASPLYVLNTGIGIVILTVGAIALFFVDIDQVLGDPQIGSYIGNFGPVIISFCIVTCSTTMSSISLEGKNLWIIKSLPILPENVLLAKIAVNLTVTAPALIDALLIGIILKFGFWENFLMIVVALVCAVFISLFGLLINLVFPNFNWTTEAVVIKQSASAMIVVFTGIGIVGIQVIVLMLLPTFVMAYFIYSVLLIVTNIMLYRVIMTWGVKRFQVL